VCSASLDLTGKDIKTSALCISEFWVVSALSAGIIVFTRMI